MRRSPGTAISPVPRWTASDGSTAVPAPSARSGLSHHQVLASTSRMAVLELLRSRARPLGVAEVAGQVGLHQNTVRSHLDLLVDSGYAVRRTEAPNGPGRPRVVYEATAAPEGERNYRLLAEVLAQHLLATSKRPGEAAVKAGRSWAGLTGRRQHGDGAGTAAEPAMSEEAAVDAVVRMLGDIGFAPQLSPDHSAINLHRCPFRELAESHPDVVCGAHLGMIQGALAELGAPVRATRLLPFVQPDLCIVTLSAVTPSAGTQSAGTGAKGSAGPLT
jgi:predicted ArsR family transcriptional regulator